MEKILISACLLGEPVRFDGQSKAIDNNMIHSWLKEGRLVTVCPEVFGGLTTPRPAAEIMANSHHKTSSPLTIKVQTKESVDVSQAFIKGAQQALTLCKQHDIKFALLSARSPSCGNEKIYDGTFSKNLIDGQGVTADLLNKHGIQVFNQDQIEQLVHALNHLL